MEKEADIISEEISYEKQKKKLKKIIKILLITITIFSILLFIRLYLNYIDWQSIGY